MKVRCCAPVTLLAMVLPFAKSLFSAQKGGLLSAVINYLKNNVGYFYFVILHVRKLIFIVRLFLLTTISLIVAISSQAQPDIVRIAQHIEEGAHYLLKPESEKEDLDSANYFINHELSLSRSIASDKWTNASLLWKGNYYRENNRSLN